MTVVGQPSEFAGWHFPRCDGSICARTSYEDGEHLGTKEPPNRLTLTFKCRIKRREAWCHLSQRVNITNVISVGEAGSIFWSIPNHSRLDQPDIAAYHFDL